MQTATGAISPLVKEGIQVAEKDTVESVAKDAAGGIITKIAGGALGSLGGPIGMIAMSMLPMALPIIGKAFSGFMSMFGGGNAKPNTGGYTPPATVKQIQDKIAADQQKLAPLLKARAAGTLTTAQFQQMTQLQNNISALQASLPGAKQNQSTLAQTTLDDLLGVNNKGPSLLGAKKVFDSLKKTVGGYVYTTGPKGTIARYQSNGFVPASDYSAIYSALPDDQKTAFAAKYGSYGKNGKPIPASVFSNMKTYVSSAIKYSQNLLTGTYAGSLQGQTYDDYLGAQAMLKRQNNNRYNDDTYINGKLTRVGRYVIKTGGIGTNLSAADFATARSNLEARAANVTTEFNKDTALANKYGTTTDLGKQLLHAAENARSQAKNDLKELAQLTKEQHMSKDSQKGIATEIASALKLLYTDKKLSASEIGTSVAQALGSGGITTAVITQLKNDLARN
jgi:hypothetical protein